MKGALTLTKTGYVRIAAKEFNYGHRVSFYAQHAEYLIISYKVKEHDRAQAIEQAIKLYGQIKEKYQFKIAY